MAQAHERGARLRGPLDQSRAVPIGDYGFLSDGGVSALVAPSGSVEWMCLPRFDSPSVFGSILGRRAGSFTVAPLGVRVPADRRYLPGTMILETSWGTPTGWMIVRDVLLVGPRHRAEDRSRTYQRTPTDYEAEHVLLPASAASPARCKSSWTASRCSTTARNPSSRPTRVTANGTRGPRPPTPTCP